jgi:hypothetical protein
VKPQLKEREIIMMNRHERRRAKALSRNHTGAAAFSFDATLPVGEIPDDITTDIAKVVRSIEWRLTDDIAGMCFWRAMTGFATLSGLDIPAKPALGGMVYRTGPDERCDVVAFCGEGNLGRKSPRGILAHYFLVSGQDIIDFSVGDWKGNSLTVPDVVVPGQAPLPPICWTTTAPDFFWAHHSNFTPDRSAFTPELGRAWYTGFADDPPDLIAMMDDSMPQIKTVMPHIARGIEHYALRERLFAVRNGHTAVRLSQLARIVDDPVLMERAKRDEKLIVLRGKIDITPEIARETLAEAFRS